MRPTAPHFEPCALRHVSQLRLGCCHCALSLITCTARCGQSAAASVAAHVFQKPQRGSTQLIQPIFMSALGPSHMVTRGFFHQILETRQGSEPASSGFLWSKIDSPEQLLPTAPAVLSLCTEPSVNGSQAMWTTWRSTLSWKRSKLLKVARPAQQPRAPHSPEALNPRSFEARNPRNSGALNPRSSRL